MVGSFGFEKENMDLVEKYVGEAVLIKFVLHRQMAVIKGKLSEVSQFNYVRTSSLLK